MRASKLISPAVPLEEFPPTDWQALRCIMAAVLYAEIRHEMFLQHNLEDVPAKQIYKNVFQAVDGLITESQNGG